jgi:glycosyltransferase involved in cell wall biosynthesis
MPGRRILLACYHFPPLPSVGGNRWASLARHLRILGNEVVVVTTGAYGRDADDSNWVVRTGDLNATASLRRLLRRPPLEHGLGPSVEKAPPALLTGVLVPDAFVVSWMPFALRAARRLLSVQRFDCLITTSPFESTHVLGLALGTRRPAWLVDFRDGWTFEPLRERFPTAAQRALDHALEQRVVTSAGAVVTATSPIADDIVDRFNVPAETVVTGWDPVFDAQVASAKPPHLESQVVNIVHTGSLSGPWGRDPFAFFDALARLKESEPLAYARLRLVLAGRLAPRDAAAIGDRGLNGVVRHVGQLQRPEAAALQRSADVLLLVTSSNSSEATGKLWEYIVAGPPILALADGNVAARIVNETGTGMTVSPNDVEAIANALRCAAEAGLRVEPDRKRIEEFVQPAPARAMAAAIERAIAAQPRR